MTDHNQNIEVRIGSEKSFGLVFGTIFVIIGLYPLIGKQGPLYWSLLLGVVLIALSYIAPKIFSRANRVWFRFGMMLGSVISPIVMGFIYVVTFIPIGIILKIFRKELLHKKPDKNLESYWIVYDEPKGSMKNQF